MAIKTIKESGCVFEIDCDVHIKIDKCDEYRQISYLGLKAVDLAFSVGKKIYFVEIKCYEYFKDLLDDSEGKITQELINKLADSIFFLGSVKTNNADLKDLKSVLFNALNATEKVVFLIVVCPMCSNNSKIKLKSDQVMIIREVLKNRLRRAENVFNLLFFVDSYHNKFGIFNRIIIQ